LERYPNVKLIPFRQLTAPRHAMHMKSRNGNICDCTHWCHSTPLWRAVLGGMMDTLKGREGFQWQ